MPRKSTTLTCSQCKGAADLYSGVKNNRLYTNLCEKCVGVFGSAEFARRYDRQYQRRHYAKDIIQPADKADYIKAYPERAREIYSDEDFRRFS